MRRRYDIPFSLHAGEIDIPGHQVHDALVVGASRIGHAVNLITDPDTVLLMDHAEIPIETSLVSNQVLQYTPDLAQHPFPLYLRSGIPMCLNTDDPGAWGGSLTDDFFLAATLYHLSWRELVGLARNSLRYAFVDNETKARLETRLNQELSEFELRMSLNDWRSTLSRSHQPSDFARQNLRLDDSRPSPLILIWVDGVPVVKHSCGNQDLCTNGDSVYIPLLFRTRTKPSACRTTSPRATVRRRARPSGGLTSFPVQLRSHQGDELLSRLP